MARPRKPTATKRLQGTFRKDRATVGEWTPPAGAPVIPAWLGEDARRLWETLVPELMAGGVLTVVDGEAFANYCAQQTLVAKLQATVDANPFATTPQNALVANLLREARKLAQQLGGEFGLSPSSRSRVGTRPKSAAPDADEVELFGAGPLGVIEGGKT